MSARHLPHCRGDVVTSAAYTCFQNHGRFSPRPCWRPHGGLLRVDVLMPEARLLWSGAERHGWEYIPSREESRPEFHGVQTEAMPQSSSRHYRSISQSMRPARHAGVNRRFHDRSVRGSRTLKPRRSPWRTAGYDGPRINAQHQEPLHLRAICPVGNDEFSHSLAPQPTA
jgi:hypothetical protein